MAFRRLARASSIRPAWPAPLRAARRAAAQLGLAAAVAFGLAGATAAQETPDPLTVDRISAYLNSVETMKGSFVQLSPDGQLSEGAFFMRRPGRLRLEYRPPNPTLIVADGFWVAVIDKDFESVDRFPVTETPLNLILQADVDLGAEGAIRSVERSDGQLRVTAIDPGDAGQGDLVMVFDTAPVLALRQWIVTDAQGLTTTVALRTTQENVPLAASLFVIPESDFNDRD